MSKTAEKQKNKRTNILDAAYDLFVNKSFVNTSIDDVVRKAGIAKGTFYLYFTDKYDLVDRLIIQKALFCSRTPFQVLKPKKENGT